MDFLCVGGEGGIGRGKCTGKESLRGSDISEVLAAFLCVFGKMNLKTL